jgi:hypothetical protein
MAAAVMKVKQLNVCIATLKNIFKLDKVIFSVAVVIASIIMMAFRIQVLDVLVKRPKISFH